jgi:serine protease Do
LVAATKPGQKTSLQVFRRGDYKTLSVTVAELEPEGSKTAAAEPTVPSKLAKSALGLTLTNVDAATKRELGLAGGAQVLKAEGPAASVGIKPGDVILALGNVKVTDVAQFDALLGKVDLKRPLSVLVRRGEWAQYAVIRPNKPQ